MNPNVTDSSITSVCVISGSESVNYHRQPPPPYSENNAPITSQPVVQTIVVQPPLKAVPTVSICPECRETVITTVKVVNTKNTHMLAGFIFGFTCWCCLCCLAAAPYLLPSCKKPQHFCPQCKTFLGPY